MLQCLYSPEITWSRRDQIHCYLTCQEKQKGNDRGAAYTFNAPSLMIGGRQQNPKCFWYITFVATIAYIKLKNRIRLWALTYCGSSGGVVAADGAEASCCLPSPLVLAPRSSSSSSSSDDWASLFRRALNLMKALSFKIKAANGRIPI